MDKDNIVSAVTPVVIDSTPDSTPGAAGVSLDVLEASVVNYKQQHEHMTSQLTQLERNYAENKAVAVKTLDMLVGAIAAVEQLVQNVKDAAAVTAKPDEAPQG